MFPCGHQSNKSDTEPKTHSFIGVMRWCWSEDKWMRFINCVFFEGRSRLFCSHPGSTYENNYKMTMSQVMYWYLPNDKLVKLTTSRKCRKYGNVLFYHTRWWKPWGGWGLCWLRMFGVGGGGGCIFVGDTDRGWGVGGRVKIISSNNIVSRPLPPPSH